MTSYGCPRRAWSLVERDKNVRVGHGHGSLMKMITHIYPGQCFTQKNDSRKGDLLTQIDGRID